MSRHERACRIARVRTAAGLGAAVIPFAILIHLLAEGFSLGPRGVDAGFIVRHLYLGVAFVVAALVFARTVGMGSVAAERRRRCALIGAQLRGAGAPLDIASLALSNVAFFGLCQLVEGVPIASGDWCLGLAAAVAGSLITAFVIVVFGRSIAIAALLAIGVLARRHQPGARIESPPWRNAPRCAAAAFTLFVPNRPPPAPFL